jgi:hypothetical protein
MPVTDANQKGLSEICTKWSTAAEWLPLATVTFACGNMVGEVSIRYVVCVVSYLCSNSLLPS